MDGLQSLDQKLFLLINSFHSSWLNPIMSLFSGQGIWAPFIGFFFWYSWKKFGKRETFLFALFLFLTLIASDVTSSYLIKNIVQRLRPCRLEDLKPLIYSFGQKCGGKFGFVSSHAANSVALVIFSMRTFKFDKKWTLLIWVLPLLVGWSRIYLGVHYPGDILGGTLVGVLWGLAFSSMLNSIYGASRNLSH